MFYKEKWISYFIKVIEEKQARKKFVFGWLLRVGNFVIG